MVRDHGKRPGQKNARAVADRLRKNLEGSPLLDFEDLDGDDSDGYDGWGITIATLQRLPVGSRVYVRCWAGRFWRAGDGQIWAGLNCSRRTPFHRAIKFSEGLLAPQRLIGKADVRKVAGVRLVKTNIPAPQAMEPVLEAYDEGCYLGLFRFDADVAALADTASDMIEDFVDATLTNSISNNKKLTETKREQVISARRGQGEYRRQLKLVERKCRLTGVSDDRLLTASHMKPWSRCRTNKERLDGHNGLLLTPTVDRLFDRGLLTFNDDGTPRWSSRFSDDQRALLKFDETTPVFQSFNNRQRSYLKYHQRHIFKP
jgi:hypothetical protein